MATSSPGGPYQAVSNFGAKATRVQGCAAHLFKHCTTTWHLGWSLANFPSKVEMQQHTWPGKQPNADVALWPQNACMSACLGLWSRSIRSLYP